MNTLEFIKYEWKLQFNSRAALLTLFVFVSVLLYGGIAGKAERDERSSSIDLHHASVTVTMNDWLKHLQMLEQNDETANLSPVTGSAMDVVFASSLPQKPLSDFAIGQSDLLPFVGEISLRDPDIRLFSKYEFADPVGLALGSFDISKAILLFLPLILIVFCFDVISADRDSKRLGLIISQGMDLRNFFWRRLLLRMSVVLTVTCVPAIFVLIYNQGQGAAGDRLTSFGVWLMFTFFYGFLWTVLIGAIASLNKSGEFNVMALLGLWVGLTLIVPATSSSIAEALYPTPSRLTYLAEARDVENETRLTESDVVNEFMLDHPELLVDVESQFPDYVSSAFLVTSTVDEATRPIISSFDESLARRENLLEFFNYFSPAIVVHSLFNEIAGTSGQRHQSYLSQAREFKANYAQLVGPSIVGKQPLSSAFFKNIPRFQFAEESFLRRVTGSLKPIIFLLLLSISLTFFVNRQLGRLSPVSS